MKAFNVILGIFALIASFFCFMQPVRTFLSAGWIVAILLCAFGFCALFEVFRNRKKEGNGMSAVSAVIALIGGIAAMVASIVMILKPASSLFTDAFFLYILMFWLVFSGVTSIITAFKIMKPNGNKMWVFTMIWGILTILGGLYGFSHMLLMAFVVAEVIGVQLVIYGVRLIASLAE